MFDYTLVKRILPFSLSEYERWIVISLYHFTISFEQLLKETPFSVSPHRHETIEEICSNSFILLYNFTSFTFDECFKVSFDCCRTHLIKFTLYNNNRTPISIQLWETCAEHTTSHRLCWFKCGKIYANSFTWRFNPIERVSLIGKCFNHHSTDLMYTFRIQSIGRISWTSSR